MNDGIFSGHIGVVVGCECKTYMPFPYVWRKLPKEYMQVIFYVHRP